MRIGEKSSLYFDDYYNNDYNQTWIAVKGEIISEKCARLKNIFQITLLSYYFQYMAMTKCKLKKKLHLQDHLS